MPEGVLSRPPSAASRTAWSHQAIHRSVGRSNTTKTLPKPSYPKPNSKPYSNPIGLDDYTNNQPWDDYLSRVIINPNPCTHSNSNPFLNSNTSLIVTHLSWQFLISEMFLPQMSRHLHTTVSTTSKDRWCCVWDDIASFVTPTYAWTMSR